MKNVMPPIRRNPWDLLKYVIKNAVRKRSPYEKFRDSIPKPPKNKQKNKS